jgi:hypothetical protein
MLMPSIVQDQPKGLRGEFEEQDHPFPPRSTRR